MILTKHQNSEGLAKGLLPFLVPARPSYSCFPWNRYEAQETAWLLSPIRGNPAYRPSKYFTAMERAEQPSNSRLRAGMYVEKGFTGDARKVFPRDQLMDSSWGWFRAVEGFRSGALPEILSGMPVAVRAQTAIRVFAGYDECKYGDCLVKFGDSVDAALVVSIASPSDQLTPFATVTSWRDFSSAIDTITKDDWLWVNLYAYLELGLAPREGGAAGDVWSDQLLWSRFLEPMLPWISEK